MDFSQDLLNILRPWATWVAAGVLVCYLIRLMLLPRPIPGIPHTPNVSSRLLGDVLDILHYIQDTGEIASFITKKKSKEMNSPIFQLFLRPFERPWVIITDFRETQDIILRRTKEFDRATMFVDIFSSLVPGSMVHMPTGDVWKGQRKMVGDTMTPAFLESVSAPSIYQSVQVLLSLWAEKTRLAEGRPFDVKEDVHRNGLDTIWHVAFGSQIAATQGQLILLAGTKSVNVPASKDDEVIFSTADDPEAFKSILLLTESVAIPVSSAIPRLHHWLALNFMPSYIRAGKHKDNLIETQTKIALEKFSRKDASDKDVTCALDHVIQREVQAAAKESRQTNLNSYLVRDELFAFLIGGHDTSSTTLSWGLKMITDHQDVQHELRKQLFEHFKQARGAKQLPSVKELYRAKIPYLDATLEEIYRLSGTSSELFRKTTQDVIVLGHVIPKGTDVALVTTGPDFITPAVHVDESKRSISSQEAKGKTGSWDMSTIGEFMPERWLIAGPDGKPEFNPQAGPSLLFGGGMRGCFGRRLAELQLKMMLALIVWSFELQPTPVELSSYRAKDGITHAPRQCYLRLVAT